MSGITHGWTSAATPDSSDVTPTNFNNHTFTYLDPSGLTGATAATRYVGGTTSGAPASGTFSTGDFVITQDGLLYICTTAGSPGTWSQVGGSSSSWPPIDHAYTIDATYGDDFTAASLDARWTRRNFVAGNETFQQGINATYLRLACGGRAVGDGYFQTAPASDWTIAAKFIMRNYGGNVPAFGIGVVDTAGTGVAANFYSNPVALLVYGVTTYTTYGGSFTSVGGGGTNSYFGDATASQLKERPLWVKLRKSGTSYYGAYSVDGEVWSAESPAWTWAGTVDRVCMRFGALGNVTGVNTAATVDVDWFNKIA